VQRIPPIEASTIIITMVT